jgi:hypothetical protein
MPGPVSDSYDPEFGTSANAAAVKEIIEKARDKLNPALGKELKNIVEVAYGKPGGTFSVKLTEQNLRALRFAANRVIEEI